MCGSIERAVLREQLSHRPLVLHADNCSPMKDSTLHVTLERLGITPSHSRPRVSDDNAFSEALFRTCKYRPDYPASGIEAARQWVLAFVRWYNEEHRHSAIRFVTPAQRHAGEDVAMRSISKSAQNGQGGGQGRHGTGRPSARFG